jgi:hypothetical protein
MGEYFFETFNSSIMQNLKNEDLTFIKSKKFEAQIGEKIFPFDHPKVTGKELLHKAGINNPECVSLYQKLKGCDFEKISLNEIVDLSHPGLEKFVVKEPESWNYWVDEEPETSTESELSANQILTNAGLTPATDYYLVEFDNAGNEFSHKDTPDAPIQLKCPGSKFVSVFKGETPVS